MTQYRNRMIRRGAMAVAATCVLGFVAVFFANAAQTAQTNMGIIMVDRNAFFVDSLAGQDMSLQVQEMRKTIEDELTKKVDQLRTEEEQLVNQQGLLTPEAFETKAKTLREKRLALQREADDKSRQLQAGILTAQNKIWQATSPILDDILKEQQAILMLERSAVVKGTVDLDVTATALQRLNDKLPKVKVELAELKAGQ